MAPSFLLLFVATLLVNLPGNQSQKVLQKSGYHHHHHYHRHHPYPPEGPYAVTPVVDPWFHYSPDPKTTTTMTPPMCKSVADICIILDSSGSIKDNNRPNGPDNWDLSLNFVNGIVERLPIATDEVRVGMVVFSMTVELEFGLGEISNKTQLRQQIASTHYRGSYTNTADALELTSSRCFSTKKDRSGVRNIAIFISDGVPTVKVNDTQQAIEKLHAVAHRVISVGITDKINQTLLSQIAKGYGVEVLNGTDYFTTIDFTTLNDLIPNIAEEACTTAPPLPDVCFGQLDLCLIIDSSGSIRDQNPDDGTDNWETMLAFVNELINSLDIGAEKIRVGAVKFSNNAKMLFYMDDFTDKAALQRNISATSYSGGYTNTTGALRLTKTECFKRSRGERRNVPNMAIIITDGLATINKEDTIPEANNLKGNNTVDVVAIGITDVIDNQTLKRISSPPQMLNKNYYSSPDFKRLSGLIVNLVKRVCEITVEVPKCDQQTDIAFLVDASEATSRDIDWDLLKELLKLTVEAYDVERGAARVALVLYAGSSRVVFYLNSYTRMDDILDRINNIRNMGGRSNLAEGLRRLRNDVFVGSRGDRRNIRDVAVIFMATPPTRGSTRNEINALRNDGVEVFALGLTSSVTRGDLSPLVSEPLDQHLFTASGFDSAAKVLPGLVPNTCIALVTDCTGEVADIVFVVDSSGSIRQDNYRSVKDFVSTIIGGLDVNSRRFQVGVIAFSDNTREIFKLNSYRRSTDMQLAVDAMPYIRGTTNTAAALRYAREVFFSANNGNRQEARDILIVITDGASNNAATTLAEARRARLDGIHIITVGVGNWLDQYELEAMASYPTGLNRFHVEDFRALADISETLRNALCDNTNECVSNPCRNGGTCENRVGYYMCKCPPGFSGINCEKQCRVSGDIALVLDSSGSIGKVNFDLMLDYVTDLVLDLDVDNADSSRNGVRVAMVTYSNSARLQFNLNDHLTKADVLNALRTNYTGGTTNTAAALRMVRERIFRESEGDRRGVQNYAFILTDGRSNNPDETWKEAMALRNAGTEIIVLGIGDGVSTKELSAMASAPIDKNILKISDFQSFATTLDKVSNSLCNNENECRNNPCNGAPCKDVMNGYTCGPCPLDRSGSNCERRASGMIDLVFVIDSSGSIRNERFPVVLNFVTAIVSQLDVHSDRTRVGAIWFSDNADVQFNLNQYQTRQDVIAATRRIRFRGGRTHTSAALRRLPGMFTAGNGARETAAHITIILTDGNSNINAARTVPDAIDVKINSGVHMMVVSVGTLLNRLELEGMASAPVAANLFSVERINDLGSIVNMVTGATFDERNECDSNPCENGGNCLNSLQRFVCFCRPGFSGITCSRRCSRQLDLAFLLDLSGSVEANNRLIMQFARTVVYGLDFNLDRTRVAVIAFSDKVISQFYLNTYQDKEAVITAISFANRGGRTNIALALRRTRDEIFRGSRGDRSGVRNVAVLVSDGHSTMNEFSTVTEASATKRAGIDIFAVAVGGDVNVGEMNSIASDPDNDYVTNLRSQGDTQRASDWLLDQLCA